MTSPLTPDQIAEWKAYLEHGIVVHLSADNALRLIAAYEALRAELERLRDVVGEVDRAIIDGVLGEAQRDV